MRPVRGGAMRSRSSGRMTYSSPSSPARARGPGWGGPDRLTCVSRERESEASSKVLSVSKALFTCVCERAVGARGGVLAPPEKSTGLGLGWGGSLLFRPRAPLQVFAALSRRESVPALSGGRKPSASRDRVLGVGGRPRGSVNLVFSRSRRNFYAGDPDKGECGAQIEPRDVKTAFLLVPVTEEEGLREGLFAL